MRPPYPRIPTSLCLLAAASGLFAASSQAQEIYELGFETQPTYLRPKQVVLTFDDGPVSNQWTERVLDELKSREVKASFFVNTGPGQTVWGPGSHAETAIARIINEGHELANHTRNHEKLIDLAARPTATADLNEAIYGVDRDIMEGVASKVHPDALRPLTLFRAPYGEPYQWKFQRDVLGWPVDARVSTYPVISQIANKMVHVGWNVDSNDWMCTQSGTNDMRAEEVQAQCVFNNVKTALEGGAYGIILMHSTNEKTYLGLKLLLDYLEANNYEITSTEQAVCNAFGATSANLLAGRSGCEVGTVPPPPPEDGDDGSDGDDGAGNGCAGTAGSNTLIDDFDDGDISLPAHDDREGDWYAYAGDGMGPSVDTPAVEEVDGRKVLAFRGKNGDGATYGPGFGVSFSPDAAAACTYDARGTGGIKLTLRGTGPVRIALASPPSVESSAHFGKSVTLTGEWQDLEIPYAEMTAPSWGMVSGALDPSTLIGLVIAPETATGDVEILLDSISFLSAGTGPGGGGDGSTGDGSGGDGSGGDGSGGDGSGDGDGGDGDGGGTRKVITKKGCSVPVDSAEGTLRLFGSLGLLTMLVARRRKRS